MGRREALREATVPLTEADVVSLSERLGEPDWLRDRRLEAWRLAESMPMPSLEDEPWRRTDIRILHWDEAMRLPAAGGSLADVPRELYAPLIGEKQGGLLVFADGQLVHAELSEELARQGVIFADLVSAARDYPDLVRQTLMTRAVKADDDKIAALSGALWTHGVFLYVPRDVRVELPLHSVEYAPGGDMTGTHILVVLERGASATYLHESASPMVEGVQSLHLGATELLVGDNADLRYVALQNWGEHTFNFGHQRGRVGEYGRLDWVVGEMGTRLSKLLQTLDLDGNDSWGRMSGLYFTHHRQHLDLDTQQNHHALRTTSDLLFKGALRGRSRTVWQGMIVVDPGAQQTDGFQANRNLLLGKDARADSIPGLEIKADDVRCTHAATIGQVDETEVFYLMARGIPRTEAIKLIVQGFFDPVMQRIPFEEVRERLTASIEAKLG